MSDIAYKSYILPSWAPPSYLFGIVWPILYILMFISFSWVGIQYFRDEVTVIFMLPFLINVIANLLFVWLQFKQGWKWLATVDILVVWGSLLVILQQTLGPEGKLAWIGWTNVPYFIWVSFATVLQGFVAYYN